MNIANFAKLSSGRKVLLVLLILVALVLAYAIFSFVFSEMRSSISDVRTNNYGYQTAGLAEQSKSMLDLGGAPAAAPAPSYEAQDEVALPSTANDQRKVIKTGSLEIVVNDIDQSVSKINADAVAAGGFVQNSNLTETPSGQKYATLVLRVPASGFENLITKIKTGAKMVSRENINGREVTEEYVDLQADLTHNLAVEAQYLELLKQANKVEEIIAVRDKLDQVQGEIERLKGRLRYLDNQTEMSTISVSLTSEVKITLPANKWQPWENIKLSTKQLIVRMQGFVDFLIGFIFWLIAVIPYLIFLLIVYILARWIYRKVAKRKQNTLQ